MPSPGRREGSFIKQDTAPSLNRSQLSTAAPMVTACLLMSHPGFRVCAHGVKGIKHDIIRQSISLSCSWYELSTVGPCDHSEAADSSVTKALGKVSPHASANCMCALPIL